MQAGWYPDPYSTGYLRWWDGSQWTAHTAPMPHAGGYGDRPEDDLGKEQGAGRRASIAIALGAVLNIVELGVGVSAFAGLRHGVDQAFESATGPASVPNSGAALLVLDVLSLAGLVVEILVMIWLYRAATLARRAGLPAKRDPVWAILGFIVPVVSLWFPYQLARDLFAPNDPRRRIAARWWTWYLIATLGSVPAFIAALFSGAAGLVLGIPIAICWVLAAMYGRKLVEASGSAHGELVRQLVDR